MERGISHIIIETDSTNLVKALQSSTFDQAPSGVIFQEVCHLLDFHFVVKGIYFAHDLVTNALMLLLILV
jgi:hypothetical protein